MTIRESRWLAVKADELAILTQIDPDLAEQAGEALMVLEQLAGVGSVEVIELAGLVSGVLSLYRWSDGKSEVWCWAGDVPPAFTRVTRKIGPCAALEEICRTFDAGVSEWMADGRTSRLDLRVRIGLGRLEPDEALIELLAGRLRFIRERIIPYFKSGQAHPSHYM